MGRTLRNSGNRSGASFRRAERTFHAMRGLPEDATAIPAVHHTLHVPPDVLRIVSQDIRGERYCLNPSIAVHRGALWATVRVQFRAVPHSRAVLGVIDDRWSLTQARWMRDMSSATRHMGAHCIGFEDCRLFSWRGRLFASATVCDRVANDPTAKLAVLDINDEGNVSAVHTQRSRRQEKNWMPFVQGDRLRFIYSYDPCTVLDYDPDAHEVRPAVDGVPPGVALRGSSQLIPYGQGYLGVVHSVHAPSRPRGKNVYMHRFARFDRHLHTLGTSPPFFFEHHGIEFCAGLAEWGGAFVLAYGFDNREPRLAVIHKSVVGRMVGGEP